MNRSLNVFLILLQHQSCLLTDRQKISSALYIWRRLLKLEFTDEQTKVIRKVSKDVNTDVWLDFHVYIMICEVLAKCLLNKRNLISVSV